MSEEGGQRGLTGREGPPGREGEIGKTGEPGAAGETTAGQKGPRGERGRTGSPLPFVSMWAFIAQLVVFVIGLGVLSYYITQNRGLAQDGREAHDALCVFKDDLERRLAASRQFLADNPQGAPPITAAIIRDGIRNQQRTITALAHLDCKDQPEGET